MTVLLDQFVQSLVDSGLMTADEVQAFVDRLPPDQKPDSAEDLARLLFRDGRLTKFQAQAVYQGKTRLLVLGNYVVRERIGQGGMGHVYEAEHRRMRRNVALKVLPSALMKQPGAVERFQREVRAAARLMHPNIVAAFDADEAGGVHFLVMEHVDGIDLAATVERRGPLAVTRALDYVLQAARGLEYAHREGVVHRDVKPSNLLVDKSGTVKILDMGLARLEQEVGPDDATADAALTQSGQVMGTIDYMPPEQAEDTHRADHRADVYSLGCTLFYLLTGRPVYHGDTLTQKILGHREGEIPSLRAIRHDVPERLDDVFRKMVAKRPDGRHQSMSQVVADLEACRASLEAEVTDTLSLSQGPTGGGDTSADHTAGLASSAEKPPSGDTALEAWLNAELPEPPTALRTAPRKRFRLTNRQIVIGSVALGLVFILVLLGIVLRINTPEGTIVVHVNEPDAEISVDDGQVTLTSPGEKEPAEIEVAEGEHTLRVTKGGFQTYTDTFKIRSDGREVFNVELLPLAMAKSESGRPKAAPSAPKREIVAVEAMPKPDPAKWNGVLPADAPAPAIAPFDAATANKHQQAWAAYLGVPVEQEVTLADDVKMTMVLIPPGEFVMGSPGEERARFLEDARAAGDQWAVDRIPTEGPQHRVRITRPFYLGKYEVTQAQWEAVMGDNPSKFANAASHPVEQVSWHDVQQFLAKLNVAGTFRVPSANGGRSEPSEMTFTLPTEAQWEYACRAGTTTFWHCGDDAATLEEYAWFNVNSGGKTHPVGELLPNGFCLYDMHGNVWEWCADFWATDFYAESRLNDPSGPSAGSHRVSRGGYWNRDAGYCRSAYRNSDAPVRRHNHLGFRLASVLADERLQIVGADPMGATSDLPGRRDDSKVASEADTPPLPGIIPEPAELPGIGRWNVVTHTPLSQASSVAWHPDGNRIAFADWHGRMLRIYDADRMELCALIPADHPKRVAADPRGMWLACGKEDGAVQLWKWDGTRGPLPHQHKTKVWCLAWSPDGHVLASGAYWGDDTIRLWHVDGRPQPVLSNKGMTKCLAWRPDGRRLAAGGSSRRVRVWNPDDGSLVAELPEMTGDVNGLAWSPDGARLAAGLMHRSENSDLWIWDTSTWKTLADANLCVGERINWLGWHPQGGLAAATQDGYVMLADPATATGIARSSHVGPLKRAAWSPDGTRIVDLCGRIHQVENGKLTEIQPPWPPVEVTPISGKASAGVQVKLGDDAIAVHADGTFDGDSEVAERELMFVVEKPDGRLELLKPSEFRARVSGASGSADGRATSARSGEAPPLATAPSEAEERREAPKAISPDRRAAEWVVGIGGTVSVLLDGGRSQTVRAIDDLPQESFVLRHVDVHDNPSVNDESLRTFRGLVALFSLGLDGTATSDKGLENLGKLPGLRRLDLEDTQVTDEGLRHLEAMPSLRTLDIRFTPTSDVGLEHFKSLKDLAVLCTPERMSFEAIASFPTLRNLTILTAFPEHLTAEGIAALNRLPKLRVLGLHHRGIDDRHVPALSRLSNLGRMFVGATSISEQGVAALRKALPDCQIETENDDWQKCVWDVTFDGAQPPLAIAPFTADQARQYQYAWASHLHLPVEQEIDLGGGVTMTMVLIPPGEFMMGSSEAEIEALLEEVEESGSHYLEGYAKRILSEGPQHKVRLNRPFYLAAHEVTVGQFRAFVEATGYKTKVESSDKLGAGFVEVAGERRAATKPEFSWRNVGIERTEQHPVVNLTWDDAVEFCRLLGENEGSTCRLPTEAEWEYACRAGSTTRWFFGDDEAELRQYAWSAAIEGRYRKPVGQLAANGFGLYDVYGNVWEWCLDFYSPDYYGVSPVDDPTCSSGKDERVSRGGSAQYRAWAVRSAFRLSHHRSHVSLHVGFRPAMLLDATDLKRAGQPPAGE